MMDTQVVYLFVSALIGVLLHNLVNLNNINRRNKGTVNWGEYYALERFSILISVIVVGACSFLLNEDIHNYLASNSSNLAKYVRTGFIILGYFAQSILVSVMGKAEKYVKEGDAKKAKKSGD